MKPAAVTLEYIPPSPIDSFVLIELARLPHHPATRNLRSERDDLLEISPGRIVDGELWERGYLSFDADGRRGAHSLRRASDHAVARRQSPAGLEGQVMEWQFRHLEHFRFKLKRRHSRN